MLLAISLALWVALSAALHGYLVKTGRSAIPVMANVIAGGLVSVAGIGQLAQMWRAPQISVLHDTYYVVSQGAYALNISVYYLIAAGLALAVIRLGRGWPQRLMAPAFWVCHLGMAAAVLPVLLLQFDVPERYGDATESFRWIDLVSRQGALFSLLGMACLMILASIALGQRVFQGRAN